jgi:hypothetical protein
MVGLNIHSPWPRPEHSHDSRPSRLVVPRPWHPAARAPWPWAPRALRNGHRDRGHGTPAVPCEWMKEWSGNRGHRGPGTACTASAATALQLLPPCPVNEWMARELRAPRKEIARRGLIRAIYLYLKYNGLFAQSSWNWTKARGRRKTGYETN